MLLLLLAIVCLAGGGGGGVGVGAEPERKPRFVTVFSRVKVPLLGLLKTKLHLKKIFFFKFFT